jgi:murein DD-endopeptidase MepM/ murein hydrolase activator NlpD
LPAKSAAAIASPIFAVAPAAAVAAKEKPAATLERESDDIEGVNEINNPVLALYGASEKQAFGSFREAMSGRGVRLARHLIWPVALAARQYLSSGFGMRTDPFHGRPTFHGGIDIAAEVGTPVLATADAVVEQVTTDAGYGKYITLRHADGMLTRYGHLSAQMVSVGQRVRAGQPIGAVGSTGRSTGAHLDYRVSKDGVRYDPLSVLRVPANVAIKATNIGAGMAQAAQPAAPAAVAPRISNVASNPLPKRPMVIQVR